METVNKLDDLIIARDWRVKSIEIPALGKEVWIREITAGERDHIEGMTLAARTRPLAVRGEFRATFCAYFLSDASGRRLVPDDKIADIDKLPHEMIDEIYNAGLEFNHLSEKDVEALEKN